jgi:4-amino-4-deoxy-L-arabinose transferase-like glycosyltransferase
LLSVYKIGERLYNKKIGFFSAFFLNSFYLIIAYSKQPSRMFPLLALLSLTFLMLLKSEYFQNKKFSILFGICFGIAVLLMIASLVAPIFGAIAYAVSSIIARVFNKNSHRISKSIGLTSAVVVFFLTFCGLVWYLMFFFACSIFFQFPLWMDHIFSLIFFQINTQPNI